MTFGGFQAEDRVVGALVGLTIGDALGTPVIPSSRSYTCRETGFDDNSSQDGCTVHVG
jgi:ADP-ribosylglycohydrolase